MKRIINKIGEIIKPMLPNLPTDNLYKFGFVGCLFLIGIIVFYTVKIEISLTTSYNNYKIENINLDLEFDKLNADYNSLKNEIKFWKSKGEEVHNSKRDSLNLQIIKFDELKLAFGKNEGKINQEIKVVEYYQNIFFWFKIAMIIVVLILLLLTIKFGCLWYKKLQIHLDKLTKLEADNYENKLPKVRQTNDN